MFGMLMHGNQGSGFATVVYGRAMLPGLESQWRALCKRSVEDNVYYAPAYMLALLDSVAASSDVKIVTGWDGNRLIAFLPVILRKLTVPGLIASGEAWRTDYTNNCLPLLDDEQPDAAACTILHGLLMLKRSEWVVPELNSEGAVCHALRRALESCGAPYSLDREFERASLSIGPSFDEHMKAHVSSKRRRELARNRRRLEENGKLTLRTETSGPGLVEAVQAFLTLEASGWKGSRGTALACSPETKAFAKQAYGTSSIESASRVDLLLLSGKPIAAGVIVFSGSTGFTVKGAYDEAYGSFGAGLLLEQEVIKSFLTDRWAKRLDAATNGRHVIDCLWPDKVRVADLAFSLAGVGASNRLRAMLMLRSAARGTKTMLKRLLKR